MSMKSKGLCVAWGGGVNMCKDLVDSKCENKKYIHMPGLMMYLFNRNVFHSFSYFTLYSPICSLLDYLELKK